MGQRPPQIYGLDIETDTTRDGLDPAVASVRTVALSGRTFDEVFIGDEAGLLRALDQRLAALPAGVLATFNGATFDLPFIADRARLLGIELQLHLCLDRRLTFGRTPLPGHGGAYRAAWGPHAHLDTFRLYGGAGQPSGRGSLRALGRLLGVGGQVPAAARACDLANEALHAHAASDARLARVLAERRWAGALRLIDRLDPQDARPVSVAAERLERRARQDARPLRPAVAGL
ncbi:MAG TPA: hypothetical protein VHK88_19760 [Aquihabitans sp.]|jgi:hypothetical protein|nr:hypothetical protein [Aquihabitans sp.]